MTFGKLTFGEMTFGEMPFGEMTFGEMTFGESSGHCTVVEVLQFQFINDAQLHNFGSRS